MAYGKIKADSLVHDDGGSDVEVTISSLAAKAPLASPTFTGTPAAPTAAQGTSTTQLATTEFVNSEIAADLTAAIGTTIQGYDATILVDSDIGVTVQGYDATIVVDGDIGVTVQGYDADTTKNDVANTFTAQQTFGELKETVYTLATTGSIALDPANGSIQVSVLTGNPTFTDSLEAGQTIVLHLEGGASNTVTWPTITWTTSDGNTAPTLTAKDVLVFWKVSTTLYGAYVGSYV